MEWEKPHEDGGSITDLTQDSSHTSEKGLKWQNPWKIGNQAQLTLLGWQRAPWNSRGDIKFGYYSISGLGCKRIANIGRFMCAIKKCNYFSVKFITKTESAEGRKSPLLDSFMWQKFPEISSLI